MAHHRIPMNFADGYGSLRMRPEFKGKTTFELICSGHRTGTSRDPKKPYTKKVSSGDTVTFYNKEGQTVICRVTTAPIPLTHMDATEWSQHECWDPECFQSLKAKGYEQFRFKKI